MEIPLVNLSGIFYVNHEIQSPQIMQAFHSAIARALNVSPKQVAATLSLIKEGGTVPFIARYRKEATGSLDEVQVAAIRDQFQQLEELDKRREAIIKSLTELGLLTDELNLAIQKAESMAVLEDIYLPYKPKRKTRASVAREKGLEPLALLILVQGEGDPSTAAKIFVNPETEVANVADALAGARDIIAEIINENVEVREKMRKYFLEKSLYKSVVNKDKETEGEKYRDYFDWQESIKTAPSHRILAMRRGEAEDILKVTLLPPEDAAIHALEKQFITANNLNSRQVGLAIADGYKRLLRPAMESEARAWSKQRADEAAIGVFAENARQLLLEAPLGRKRILAIDPGFRTGCKVVCLDEQGKLLANETIYPHTGEGGKLKAAESIKTLVGAFKVEAIAIGNGTAGRETELFIQELTLDDIPVVRVNESGASIYSASAVAREEFPDHDITVRGAVSIGRRLLDPLAELVKIDPKSIGVGQYQHDVDQGKLQQSLDDTVMSCVNAVGVELNTASKEILAYVSGLGPALAQNIIDYRNTNGPFKNRESLKKVPRLGGRAFEQSAGFLRIHGAENPLDASGVHPERYTLVGRICEDMKTNVPTLIADPVVRAKVNLSLYVAKDVGLPTLQDILLELSKPGRDPREQFEAFSFAPGVNSIADLKTGMKLFGRVTNITAFGAFVDIGVHQDGLVHTSQLANRFVSNANDIVKVSQVVEVTVIEVDAQRKRISLSMKTEEKPKPTSAHKKAKPAHATNKLVSKSKSAQKSMREADGDLQIKLAALKDLFKK